MGKVTSFENAFCGLVILILVAGFLGSVVMVILLSVWQQPTAPAWTKVQQGEVYYGVEVTFNDLATVWQAALYQTTSNEFQTWSTLYCNQMAVILGPAIGRQYGGCTVISYRPGRDTSVIVQFRITLLATQSTTNVGCAAALISGALARASSNPQTTPQYRFANGTKIFNIPVPPTTSNTCQYTSSCRNSDVCQVAQSSPSGTPVCSNVTITGTCSL